MKSRQTWWIGGKVLDLLLPRFNKGLINGSVFMSKLKIEMNDTNHDNLNLLLFNNQLKSNSSFALEFYCFETIVAIDNRLANT